MACVVGILNVTPDSFSDGGRFDGTEAAIAHGLRLRAQGANIVDVGGESTRPGAARVDERTEIQRVLPVVHELADAGVIVSIDTMRSRTAAAAIRAGARYVNDVSGGRSDPQMYHLIADHDVQMVIGHWPGHRSVRRSLPTSGENTVSAVAAHLHSSVDEALRAGVAFESIVVDPGLGFGKTSEENWRLLAATPELAANGLRVLIGASRKRFLGRLLADQHGDRPIAGRDTATAVISALAVQAGAWGVRVHSVSETVDALRTAQRWRDADRLAAESTCFHKLTTPPVSAKEAAE
ncbi:dihydropteroate synthase [Rhodococcus pyridinivorans]|uniref:dihydropteroate synthase n=1 Tax=Rhodococcus pyridinivorans TaxID=103816 RepID=UPI0019072E37|nr:dihydropteroate synthase [Rhodococcus pyridinivorans]QQM52996.1 dihydropteroate synthase [Rhodococcus pyridinivorans]